VDPSSLIGAVRRQLGGGEAPEPGALRRALAARLADSRKRRGIRHELGPAVPVLVAGAAGGHENPLAIAQAMAGWDQELLAAHGCRVSPATGLRVPPPARTLYRIPVIADADEFEAALTGALADAALDRQVTADAAAKRQAEPGKKAKKRKRKPPAWESFREERGDGWVRPRPLHPGWILRSPGIRGTSRPGTAWRWTARERKGAKPGGKKKARLLAAVTHVPGIVIAQDKVATSGKASEITRFKPLLAPLPLDGAVVTSDAMQANRDNALFACKVKSAHYLWPVPGSQPTLNEQLNALPWDDAPAGAATCEITRGRIETRTVRVLPCPAGTGFEDAAQAVLIERYTTYKKKGQWHTRAEAVLCLTSLGADETTPAGLLAHVRGHWRVENFCAECAYG
jgi:hypothetical protein